MLSFFPLDVLDEIWDLIESVSEGFLTYSCCRFCGIVAGYLQVVSTCFRLFQLFQVIRLVAGDFDLLLIILACCRLFLLVGGYLC